MDGKPRKNVKHVRAFLCVLFIYIVYNKYRRKENARYC